MDMNCRQGKNLRKSLRCCDWLLSQQNVVVLTDSGALETLRLTGFVSLEHKAEREGGQTVCFGKPFHWPMATHVLENLQ